MARKKNKHAHRPPQDVIDTSRKFVGLLKLSFFRDLMLNIDIIAEEASCASANISPSDCMEGLLESMAREGYRVTRDGDTVRFEDTYDTGDLTPVDDASVELESAIATATDRASRKQGKLDLMVVE